MSVREIITNLCLLSSNLHFLSTRDELDILSQGRKSCKYENSSTGMSRKMIKCKGSESRCAPSAERVAPVCDSATSSSCFSVLDVEVDNCDGL
jgi:hypothetical protein